MVYLPRPVWESRLRDSRSGIIRWVLSDVPKDWLKWPIKDRQLWWLDPTIREAFVKLGRTGKRDRIAAIEVWREYFGYYFEECPQRYIRNINTLLGGISELERVDGFIRCGIYGPQRGFRINHPKK